MIEIIGLGDGAFKKYIGRIVTRGESIPEDVLKSVNRIIEDVRKKGDEALIKYTEKFDEIEISPNDLEITAAEMETAAKELPREDYGVIETAAKRIEAYHRHQVQEGLSFIDDLGNRLEQVVRPLKRVGVYVPGGRLPYPSTLLMNAIPAKIAGVSEIIAVHPTRGGSISPGVAAAARIAGVDRIFRIGGAQAVAALSFGTETIPKVDKVVGPGNVYVAAAKRLLFGVVDIDMIAGPSEILVISDGKCDPTHVAWDLLSQAEHDPLSASILITPDPKFAESVKGEIDAILGAEGKDMTVALESIKNFGAIIVVSDIDEAISMANEIAPEHLELIVERPRDHLEKIENAGAVFLGPNSTEPIGDYIAGTNHVLPTGSTARFSSPLGVYDFVKRMSVLEISETGLRELGPKAVRFARMEGLSAHAGAIEVRLKKDADK
ncbi:MAG: histidinol dehydrogenase [Deltaproteobacteria bacterium]|uniref:Histidinol dehydrogenase n=1 Tax=Candidatus Zymogenus saltonus TaxID=2844893 RepID=A0A9D8PR11_9DELT|nr:histidinol dehydrogenase [Candidatus Zymogenus saltonus]